MLEDNTTFEYIGRNDFVLYQQKDGFRFGTDSVLLAWFACSFVRQGRRNSQMLELGSGSGGASMCVAARLPEVRLDLTEVMETPYQILEKNIIENKISDRVRAFNCDIRDFPKEIKDISYDVVFANPPYFNSEKGPRTNEDRSSAEKLSGRFEEHGDLEDFVKAAALRVKPSGGHVCMVMKGNRLNDLIQAYNKYGITPSTLLTVHSFEDKNACIILLAGKRGTKNSEMKILPPLVLNERVDGSIKLTSRVLSIYEEEHKDCFI